MTTPASTTLPPGATEVPSTNAQPRTVRPGDIVLVCLAPGVHRPMIVSGVALVPIRQQGDPPLKEEFRINGTLFCEPEDHTMPALRGGFDRIHDPARIHGRPDRLTPFAYGECLAEGDTVGHWQRQETLK